jgi:hypothetical protein
MQPRQINYSFSLALWQMSSIEKLNAKPNANASHKDSLLRTATKIMIRQNKLAITVKAFFSVKYFFILLDIRGIFKGKIDDKNNPVLKNLDLFIVQLAKNVG